MVAVSLCIFRLQGGAWLSDLRRDAGFILFRELKTKKRAPPVAVRRKTRPRKPTESPELALVENLEVTLACSMSLFLIRGPIVGGNRWRCRLMSLQS